MDDVPEALKDAGYVLVGLGVVWFQRAQVLRRELTRDLPDLPDLREPVTRAVRGVVDAVKSALEATAPQPRPGG